MRINGSRILKTGLLAGSLAVLAACGGEDSGGSNKVSTASWTPPPPSPPPPVEETVSTQLSGSVGDGPIVGGRITILDDQGIIVARLESDQSASYTGTIEVPASRYPLRVEARGGTDLVTGAPPDFVLTSAAMHPAVRAIGNINPHSTLIVATATGLAPGPTDNALASARTTVMERMSFGLDTRLIADPVTSEVDDDNVAVMVVASERLGEMIRRTRDALAGTGVADADEIVDAIAADLADGLLDGRGMGGTDARVAAVSHLATAQVLVESLTNGLRVNGLDASRAMDDAIVRIRPAATGRTASVATTATMLTQTVVALDAAAAYTGDPIIADAAAAVRELPADILPADVAGRLPDGVSAALQAAINQAALDGDSGLETINRAVRTAEASQPGNGRFSLDAASASVVEGEVLRLTLRRDTTAGEASVEWRTVSDTAVAGDDFLGASARRLSFAAGEASKTLRVETLADGVDEDDERFIVRLQSPEGAELGTPALVEVTLVDSSDAPQSGDAGAFSIARVGGDVVEGDSAQFTIRRSASAAPASVSWETVAGSATGNEDYAAVSASPLSFAAGESQKTISVATFDDGLADGGESFSVRLLSPTGGATLGSPATATVTLLDGDGTTGDDYFPPALHAVGNDGEMYTLEWTHPRHAPEGGYDVIVDGSISQVEWRTMGLTTTVGPLDTSVGHCFRVEARYPSDGEYRLSNELCIGPADGTATLSWTPPTERVDGSVLDNLAGYEVHYGKDETRLDRVITLDNAGLTRYVVEQLGTGTWYFGMKAVDGDGRRSALSILGSKTFP